MRGTKTIQFQKVGFGVKTRGVSHLVVVYGVKWRNLKMLKMNKNSQALTYQLPERGPLSILQHFNFFGVLVGVRNSSTRFYQVITLSRPMLHLDPGENGLFRLMS